MTKVAFKVVGSGAYAKTVHAKLPFSSIEDGIVVVRSALDSNAPLNAHLVWLALAIVAFDRHLIFQSES